MMWELIFYTIVFLVALSIGDVIRAKPTFKSALKMALNRNVLVPLWFFPLFFSISLVIASYGLKELPTNLDSIIILDGTSITFQIIAMGILAVWMWDILYSWRKKKQSQYFSWVEKIDKQGLWKYTDAEIAYLKEDKEKFLAKMYKYLPILKKLKKVV
jgi:hypothetical protein